MGKGTVERRASLPPLHLTQPSSDRGQAGNLRGRRLERSNSNLFGALQNRPSQRNNDNSARLGDHTVSEGQFGLKLFGNGTKKIERFGVRYDPGQHEGRKIGPYRVVGDKTRGVEPGFIARKAWTQSDTIKLSQAGHKFSASADRWLLAKLDPAGGDNIVRQEAVRILGGPQKLNDDVSAVLANKPDMRDLVLGSLKQHHDIKRELVKEIMASEAKFTKDHYIKLDYRETEGHGVGEKRTYTLPKWNAKSFGFGPIGKFLHRLVHRNTPEQINRGAVREAIANDLMKSHGIYTQKLKLVQTTYESGSPKLLLDGTHMTGPNGESFSDFEGAIKGKVPYGQLVKLDQDGQPITNDAGHYEVDTSIQDMGRNKIFMLLLGDRDAIGSRGANKGRVGNIFAAIDPGHSLELGGQRLMERHDIHSDMSFDQPSRIAGRCYKNFTIFDQCAFSERMEGVRKLQALAQTNDDVKVFEDYEAAFRGEDDDRLDFRAEIKSMKSAYQKRRDYILQTVFADRLKVYGYDMSTLGDNDARETAKKQVLDILDMLEKISSKHKWMSDNTELAYPILTGRRSEWKVTEQGSNIEFSIEKPSRSARGMLDNFMSAMHIDDQYTVTTRQDGTIVLTVPKAQIGAAYGHFGVDNLRRHDQQGS